MCAAETSDYPDWLRVEQWVGSPFIATDDQLVPNNTVIVDAHVAPWEAVGLAMFITAAPTICTITVRFFDDAFPLVPIATLVYHLVANQVLNDIVPVQGAHMTVTISDLPAARHMSLRVVPRRGFNPTARLWSGNVILAESNVPVGAGAGHQALIPVVMAAHCTWSVYTTAVAWFATLNYEDQGGGVLAVVGASGSAVGDGEATQTVDLPPGPVRFNFTNSDGVPRNVFVGVTPQHV